jgi:hypothetical protein
VPGEAAQSACEAEQQVKQFGGTAACPAAGHRQPAA